MLAEVAAIADASGLVFSSPTGRMLSDSTMSQLVRELGIACVPYGMRSSFRDWCGETGVAREVSEACLAHVVKVVEAAYAHNDLLDRCRPVMANGEYGSGSMLVLAVRELQALAWSVDRLEAPMSEQSPNLEFDRVEAMRLDNESAGREVIPQAAAAQLFDISETAVRAAVADGRVSVCFQVSVSPFGGKPAPLLLLSDALRCWQHRAPDDLMVRLAALRRGALTFAVPIGPEDPARYFVCNVLGAIGDVKVSDLNGEAS